MAKPVTIPEWASGVPADTTRVKAPTAGKRSTGWAAGEKPAVQHANWLFYWLYQWVLYLNGFTAEALTWTAAHVFSSTVNFVGNIIGVATFLNAPTAPDYHVSTPVPMMIHPGMGTPDNSTLWTVGTFALGGATAIGYSFACPTNAGETISVTAYLLQTAAVAGGTVQLSRVDPTTGTVTSVTNVPIATATGVQSIVVVTGHAVVSGAVYSVQVNYGASGGFKNIFGLKKAWTR